MTIPSRPDNDRFADWDQDSLKRIVTGKGEGVDVADEPLPPSGIRPTPPPMGGKNPNRFTDWDETTVKITRAGKKKKKPKKKR